MVKVRDEVKANYEAYLTTFSTAITKNIATFKGDAKLVESYARVAVVNAIKVELVDTHFSNDAAHFFFEAHNDALLSHVNASFGSWRPALQALRSYMENTMSAIYYKDHPVELEKWKTGSFKIQPKDLRDYISDHPRITKVSSTIDLKNLLDKEYATLSKAVHGSSSLFRMTSSDGKTNIAAPNVADLGKWSTRESSVINLCTVMMLCILGDHLDGAKQSSLRDILGVALSANSRAALKKHLKINIPAP